VGFAKEEMSILIWKQISLVALQGSGDYGLLHPREKNCLLHKVALTQAFFVCQ
jgi:hypothetical protein